MKPTAAIIHNLNNVLFGILGCAEHALARLPPDSEAREDVEQICRAAMSGAAYGKQLIFAPHGPNDQRTYAMDAVVRNVECILQRMLGDESTLEMRLRAKDAKLFGEAFHVEQVLLNLVINARHAMPGGGRVRIHTRALTCPQIFVRRMPTTLRWIMLRVEDTGVGMDEQTCARAFESGPLPRENGGGGTGLGLSSVRAMVEQNGGRVFLRSKLGEGTCVTIFWPRADEAQPRVTESGYPVQGRKGLTVLMVEDEALVALSVQHHLVGAGHRVLHARSARQAFEIATHHAEPIDLLLTDMVLPGREDGLAVARTLQVMHPGISVLYMSAHPRAWLVRQGKLTPGARAIEKPFTPTQLLEAVSRVIENRPSLVPPPMSSPPPPPRPRQTTPDLGASR